MGEGLPRNYFWQTEVGAVMASTTAPALAALIAGLEKLGPWRVPLDVEAEDFYIGQRHVQEVAKLVDIYFASCGAVLSANSYRVKPGDHEFIDTQESLEAWGFLQMFEFAYEQAVFDYSPMGRALTKADNDRKDR